MIGSKKPLVAIATRGAYLKRVIQIVYCYWGGWTRTINFLINSQAVCQLTYAPSFVVSNNKTARLRIWRAASTQMNAR